MVLNMKPYSKEGIAELERAATGAVATNGPGGVADADADAAPEHGDDYYEYELSGVTVHTGSMDRGERVQWQNNGREDVCTSATTLRWVFLM